MTVAKANNDIPQIVNFAIKSTIALNFLDSNGIVTGSGTENPTPLDPATVADQAKAYTVHVTCR